MPVTKKIMQQYENIRSKGVCNMFDYYCVVKMADRLKYFALAALTYEEYKDLLMNFGKYMKDFNIY